MWPNLVRKAAQQAGAARAGAEAGPIPAIAEEGEEGQRSSAGRGASGAGGAYGGGRAERVLSVPAFAEAASGGAQGRRLMGVATTSF